jgi:PadR family transcriptional regulator, regulatory protein PadR
MVIYISLTVKRGLTSLRRAATLFQQGSFPHMGSDERFAAIRKGLLEYAILRIVAAEKVYAADILHRLADTVFATQEGTLYPLLSKMRREGLLDYEWQESDAGPPRKYYQLTPLGRSQLDGLSDYWKRLNATLALLGR